MIGVMGVPRDIPAGAELAYTYHVDFWGKGYGTESLRLFLGIYWAPGSKSAVDTEFRCFRIAVMDGIRTSYQLT